MLLRFRYVFNHPFAMDGGGAKIFIKSVTQELAKNHEVKHLDMEGENLDFDVLLVFTFTFWDVEVLKWYKSKGIRIIVFPIFDRTQSMFKYKLLKPFWKTVIGKSSVHVIRKNILKLADFVITSNQTEQKELEIIYDLDSTKATTLHLALSNEFFGVAETVTKDLFVDQYGIEEFVFCPAMSINNRKNQLNLIKAIAGTDFKLVLNNTDRIEDGLEPEFQSLAKANPNILCLERMTSEMMISAYKACSITCSVSNAETAGYTNLEAGYCGAKLVVSNIPAFREYLQEGAIFVDQSSPQSILNGLLEAQKSEANSIVKDLVTGEYQWSKYANKILELLG
jgi:glycosyltransferase involved in cell wall biosynthesis